MDYKNNHIAVVGVSADPQKYGHKVFRDLLAGKYQVAAVNPKGGTILNQPVYTTLRNIPTVPDLVITVVPPAVTEAIVEECHELGIPHIWMQPGSSSEEAVRKAEAYGMEATEVCFMTVNGIW
ncbi:MAG: hypothetical protein RI947_323 [Candidatus Parcubacteria bacterium]|jgi:predicted CoA-binding protein